MLPTFITGTLVAFGMGGPYDIAIVAGVIILLFGGAKLTELGKSMGTGIREFKRATREEGAPAPGADTAEDRRDSANAQPATKTSV